jgi:hypothetical protein
MLGTSVLCIFEFPVLVLANYLVTWTTNWHDFKVVAEVSVLSAAVLATGSVDAAWPHKQIFC